MSNSGTTAGPYSLKRKVNSGTTQKKFTFKEAKRVSTAERADGRKKAGLTRKQDVENERIAKGTDQMLAKLGASEEERSRFLSLCETCNVGKQDFNKTTLQTLFGDDNFAGLTKGRSYYALSDEDDEMSGTNRRMIETNDRLGGRFLKRTAEANNDGGGGLFGTARKQNRKQTQQLGSNRVYFITIVTSVTSTPIGGLRNTRRQDSVFLNLPPKPNSGHRASNVSQERLADLMIMKLFFVVRYIYVSMQKELTKENSNETGRFRYPVVVVRQDRPTGAEHSTQSSVWFKMMKDKINRGEGTYARDLSLKYYCNVI